MAVGKRRSKAPVVRQKLHVRRGDRVKVIRGNDAGKEGTVLRVLPKQNRVVIEGVNLRRGRPRRRARARPRRQVAGARGAQIPSRRARSIVRPA